MIFVFVIDTSPSMAKPAVGETGMSRLDTAKMVVEDLSRQLKKRHTEHIRFLMQDANPSLQRSIVNLGQKGNLAGSGDTLLLLSTSRQYPDTASCAAGGRLLVGFGASSSLSNESFGMATDVHGMQHPDSVGGWHHHERMESFQHELKSLRTAQWDDPSNTPFPEDAGGAVGLNAALSAGMQLLSRYRLQNRLTENFGMGRLPNAAIVMPNGSPAVPALQPACLVLVTDGACLRQPPKLGGGSLQLQFGSAPLREFYTEPFRWDQRVFCLGVGGREDLQSSQYLHPQLRALCEVTGGSHWMVRSTSDLQGVTEALLKRIRPPLPRELPLPDPLFLRLQQANMTPTTTPVIATIPGSSFISGGPVCSFQSLEIDEGLRGPMKLRAMLLYTGACATIQTQPGDAEPVLSPPLWCIPESFFPSKKLDTLPPRTAQPLLFFSKYPAGLGSKSFEPGQVIKMLHRLDQLVTSSRKMVGQQPRLLHRDVYICEWLNQEGGKPVQVSISSRQEYFPVLCRGAGRQTLSDDAAQSFLNLGILHVPTTTSSTLASQAGPTRLATLTLLPPEPHVLLPLLFRAAELEHRALKKAEAAIGKPPSDGNATLVYKQIASKAAITLDEQWRSEFRAYLFRLPPYYLPALRRTLRSLLPSSASALIPTEGMETIALQCFSKNCLQKIRNGEQVSKETIERLERQEASLKRRVVVGDSSPEKVQPLRYGQFDPRSSVDSYLAALRNMPSPWSTRSSSQQHNDDKKLHDGRSDTGSTVEGDAEENTSPKSAVDLLGELPAECLMAYYESRRRWIFGGPSLSTRGLHVEGINNGGSNSQRCTGGASGTQECLLSVGGVGVSTLNQTSTTKMGDYRERLLFSRSPVVGYGSNDAAGVAATTAVDGSPRWSVDDDAMPMTFFDPKTGEFADSVQARMRSRLMVNFGNPYKEKRADSLIPEKFLPQAPSMQSGFGSVIGSPRTPPGSPPHDSFDSVEEGEAIFVRKSPSRSSPKREEPDELVQAPEPKRARHEVFAGSEKKRAKTETKPPPPPTKASPVTPAPPKAPPAPSALKIPSNPPVPPSKSPNNAAKPPPPKGPGAKKLPPPPRPPHPKPPASKPIPPSPSKVSPQPKVLKPASRPEGGRAAAPPSGQKAQNVPAARSALAPPELDLQNPNKKPEVDLPQGWMCVWSKSQKRWYFFDTKTNRSVWRWPPE